MKIPVRRAPYYCFYLTIKMMHLLLNEDTYKKLREIAHAKVPKLLVKIKNPDQIKEEPTIGVEIHSLQYQPTCNQDLPSVSIIMATLGKRESLAVSLESVKRNSVGLDLELIIVAPMSAHERLDDILEELQIINYMLVTDDEQGIYQAMNIGIQKAKKDYVVFLNDDDRIIENAISTTFELSRSRNFPDLIACNSLYHYVCCNYFNLIKAEESLGSGILHGSMSTSHQSQIWNRKILLELGGFRTEINRRIVLGRKLKISLASDFDLFVRAVSKGITYKQINVNMSISSPTGASLTSWRKTYIELLQIVWHTQKPGFKWLLQLPFLVFSIETFHRNSGWLHEH